MSVDVIQQNSVVHVTTQNDTVVINGLNDSVSVQSSSNTAEIASVVIEGPQYTGPYTVTPNANEQILYTKSKLLGENIIINPIPSNYGLITWNGSVLTVS